MKYRQLSKEQLESLHEEFAQFLASQDIDVKEWNSIKETNPKLVEEELNLFSDMVWDKVLSNVNYVDHISDKFYNLFKCDEFQMTRIAIQINGSKSFTNESDLQWVLKNLKDDAVEIFAGSKKYSKERNKEIFKIIESGGEISNGQVFQHLSSVLGH